MTTHQKNDPTDLTWGDVAFIEDWLNTALLTMDAEVAASDGIAAGEYSAFTHFANTTRQQSLTELVESLHLNHVVEERVS